MLKISVLAILLLKQLEGYSENVYRNGGGRETIGYGHLVRTGENWSGGISKEQGEKLLEADLARIEKGMAALITVPLSQNQWDAIAIWTYNLGTGNLKSSTLLKKLNARKFSDVPFQMMRWVHIKHKDTGMVEVSNGLVKRRAKEVVLWNGKASA